MPSITKAGDVITVLLFIIMIVMMNPVFWNIGFFPKACPRSGGC